MTDRFEIAISFDTTSSMYRYLAEVRQRLDQIVRRLKREIPGIRIAIFAHGDYSSSRYVTKHINFTDDVKRLCLFVNGVEKTHGHDIPECYELVLREVQEKLSWSNNSQKVLVMVGDAPPHEPDYKLNRRRIDWRVETRRLRDMNVKIYAVDCLGKYQKFYQHIAAQTFGYYWRLSDITEVGDLLLNICFREAGLEKSGSFTEVAGSIPSLKQAHSTDQVAGAWGVDTSEIDRLMEESSSDEEDGAGLRCDRCHVVKLPNEFPAENLTQECSHFPGACLRCVVQYVKEHGQCPNKDCKTEVSGDCQQIRVYEARLDAMFVDYASVYAENRKKAASATGDVITVSTIGGDTVWIRYDPRMTIINLKKAVEDELDIKEANQKILFNDTGLKKYRDPLRPSRLQDYGIQNGDQLTLIVPLYCIPEDLDHVVFDLFWEFPRHNPDFLDASCFAFSGSEFIQVIDWNHSTNTYYLKDAIQHSAKNETRGGGKFGHQTLHVHLKRLPSNISHLYFTLSSWRSDNLSAFSNPSLQFYDASNPEVNLCSTTFTHALSHQAVVMCSVVRAGYQWQIFECDASGCVNGNAKKYNPIRERIVQLIETDR